VLPGGPFLRSSAAAAFEVKAPWWTFEDLDIEGTCSSHDLCEHAFHIIGQADHTTVRGCVMHEYNAQIKGNADDVGDTRIWPNDVIVENSEMYSSTIRDTGNPVTPLDIVGGQRWIVRGNYIHDHSKGRSDKVSYAAFFKGNSRDGLFERNLVVCEVLHTGGTRLGLSLGGGGSYPDSICEQSDCSIEHTNGVLRNNIIAHCPADVGMYINEAANTKIYNNLLYDNGGIDVRYSVSSADIRNNIISGDINIRDSATVVESSNRVWLQDVFWNAWFTDAANLDFTIVDGTQIIDMGENVAEVTDDFCLNDRDDGATDLGPVETDGDGPCDTTRPYVAPDEPVDTGGDTGGDSGTSTDTAPTETGDSGTTDSTPPESGDSGGPAGDSGEPIEDDDETGLCGCAAAEGAAPWSLGWLVLLAGRVRRRR